MKHTICSTTGRAFVVPMPSDEHPLVAITLRHVMDNQVTLLLKPAEAAALSQALDLAAEEVAADPDPIELPPGVSAPEKAAAASCAASAWPAFPGVPAGAPA